MKNPKVFVSYSWDSQEHKDWILALVTELRKNGIDAQYDEFILQKGTVNMNQMMIEQIRDSDYTIIVLTDKYAEKAESFTGGVGYETSLLINEIKENIQKIIPVIRFKGDKSKVIPFYLKGISYNDFSDDNKFYSDFEDLKCKILKKDRIVIEPLGPIPNLYPKDITIDNFNNNISTNNVLIPDFRQITDSDKIIFMINSYNNIIQQLSDLGEQTKHKNPNFDYKIDIVTNKELIIKYYINGMEKKTVKIWLSNILSKHGDIMLSYDQNYFSNTSWNESIGCEIDKNKNLKLKMTMQSYGNTDLKDENEVGIEIWMNIIEYLK